MIWLYVGWLILLLGATIAFYRQHPEYLSGRQLSGHLSHADRERLALQAVRLIGERYYGDGKPPDAESLAQTLRVPANAVELILAPLEMRGLVASTDANPPGFLPGCPWERASVHDVLDATLQASRDGQFRRAVAGVGGPVDALLSQHNRILAEAFGGVSLKSLATGEATIQPPQAVSPETPARAPS